MTTLYHYIHCPFCIRVRLVFGLLKTSYTTKVLPYSDESTPIQLTGVKMLPIATINGKSLNESLDIIKLVDTDNELSLDLLDEKQKRDRVEDLISRLAKPIHNLCMPYWAYSKEFNDESRAYFMKKKEAKRGPFFKLMQNKKEYLDQLAPLLQELESKIDSFYESETLTIFDVMIASQIWGMYVFPEFQFSEKLHSYLQRVGQLCSFDYHEDFWSDEANEA